MMYILHVRTHLFDVYEICFSQHVIMERILYKVNWIKNNIEIMITEIPQLFTLEQQKKNVDSPATKNK